MIDANEIGRSGYKLFRETAMVPDKDKHDLSFKEIGQVLNVSESRISQLHSKANLRLRAKLTSVRKGIF